MKLDDILGITSNTIEDTTRDATHIDIWDIIPNQINRLPGFQHVIMKAVGVSYGDDSEDILYMILNEDINEIEY